MTINISAPHKKLAMAVMTLACGMAYAQDNSLDPRSLAMGGTGVTTSNAGNADFHNPAMLASVKTSNEENFAIALPILGFRLQDEKDLQNDVSDLQKNGDALSSSANAFRSALNSYNSVQNPTNLSNLQAAAGSASSALNRFNNSILLINDKAVSANGLAGLMIAIPSKSSAVSLFADARLEMGARFNYATADQALVTGLSNNLTTCSSGTIANCNNAGSNFDSSGQVTGLQSKLIVRGAVVGEIGLAIARHFDSLGGVDIGIAPKMTKFSTVDFAEGAQDHPELTLDQGKKDYSSFNVDLGVAKTFSLADGDDIKVGVAARDILSRSFVTVLGNNIEVKPKVTFGASYLTKLTTLGLDIDLVPNKPMVVGLIKESQFVRVGAEFDAWSWAQIRMGYRHDVKGNYAGLPSIGLGLSPFGIHLDLSVASAGKKEVAVSLQAGFRF